MGSDPFTQNYRMIILMLHTVHSCKEKEPGFSPWICLNYHITLLPLEILEEAADSIYSSTPHYRLI